MGLVNRDEDFEFILPNEIIHFDFTVSYRMDDGILTFHLIITRTHACWLLRFDLENCDSLRIVSSKNESICTCYFFSSVNHLITLNCQHVLNTISISARNFSKIICQLKIRMWMFAFYFVLISLSVTMTSASMKQFKSQMVNAIRWKRVEVIKVNEF